MGKGTKTSKLFARTSSNVKVPSNAIPAELQKKPNHAPDMQEFLQQLTLFQAREKLPLWSDYLEYDSAQDRITRIDPARGARPINQVLRELRTPESDDWFPDQLPCAPHGQCLCGITDLDCDDYEPPENEYSDVDCNMAPKKSRKKANALISQIKAAHKSYIANYCQGRLPSTYPSPYFKTMNDFMTEAEKFGIGVDPAKFMLGIKIVMSICAEEMWSTIPAPGEKDDMDTPPRLTNLAIEEYASDFERTPTADEQALEPKARRQLRRRRKLQDAMQNDWIDPMTRTVLKACDVTLVAFITACMPTLGSVYDRTLLWMKVRLSPKPQPDQWIKRLYREIRAIGKCYLGSYLPQTTLLLRKGLTQRRLAVEDQDNDKLFARCVYYPGATDPDDGGNDGPEWSSDEEVDRMMKGKHYGVREKSPWEKAQEDTEERQRERRATMKSEWRHLYPESIMNELWDEDSDGEDPDDEEEEDAEGC